MVTAEKWQEYLNMAAGPSKPDFYVDIIRRLRDAGFQLATPEMAAVYLGNPDSTLVSMLEMESYRNLCKMVEVKGTGIFGYHTHCRSEDIFGAILNCCVHFKAYKDPVWVLPPTDDEEMISNMFVFVVGEDALDKIRKLVTPQTVHLGGGVIEIKGK